MRKNRRGKGKMEQEKITNYLLNKDEKFNFKNIEIKNEEDFLKIFKNLEMVKNTEKQILLTLEKNKKKTYAPYKIIIEKISFVKKRAKKIKDLLSKELTQGQEYVKTNKQIKKYKILEIKILNINNVKDDYLIKSLNEKKIKDAFYKFNIKNFEGLEVIEKEIIK